MFKSVFTRYFTIFMIIILVSFTILGLIYSSSSATYSQNIKKDTMRSTRDTLVSYITSDYLSSEYSDFSNYVYYHTSGISPVIKHIISAVNQDLFVLVANNDGRIQMTVDAPDGISEGAKISEQSAYNVKNTENYESYTDLEGLLPSKMLVTGGVITDNANETVGVVLICSGSSSVSGIAENAVKTTIAAILWVAAAALITVFFVTDKIVSPLKQMSEAARSFSQGKFDVRVPVSGNDEVAELATAFNNMASSLEKNEELRKTFLANVSHDLRTPMTTIAGFVDNILSGAIPYEKQNYYLGIVSSEVKRLARLVNSLLDISRIQAGDRKFVMAPFDICEMSRQIIISLEQRLEDKNLDVRFEPEHDKMLVNADRDAIYQVLYNLCDNAVKFAREGGVYKISHIERNGKIYTAVYNEGEGIVKDELPLVFDRFYKSDKSRGLDRTGVGLGLYIVKTIIDSHGEEIWVNSVYGEYCEFVFTLTPAQQPKKSAESSKKSAELSKKTTD
ncbi:MAG: HAMP domain-containing histidine kinase [Clostridia bacterium]|nr:HAMP domain-containing histidine kinase [Clostridia bacterium]